MKKHQNIAVKLMGIGSEARQKTNAEMLLKRSDSPIAKRLAIVAAGSVMRIPFVQDNVHRIIASQIPGSRREIIGSGYQQLVMADGKSVLKALVRTVTDKPKAAYEIASEMQDESDTCRSVIGSGWLATQYDVTTLKDGRSMVIAHQPYLQSGRDVHFYRSAYEVAPSLARRERTEAVDELISQHGLYPDLVGGGNMARTADNDIVQIDTIPIQPGQKNQLAFDELDVILEAWRSDG